MRQFGFVAFAAQMSEIEMAQFGGHDLRGGLGGGLVGKMAGPGEEAGLAELVPPGASLPPGPRTRANVVLPPVPGGAGDPDLLPGRRLFAPPERFEPRFSRLAAADVTTRNDALVDEGRPYLLIGFGRWGSSDPSLGIPVAWGQIGGARAIVDALEGRREAALQGFRAAVDEARVAHADFIVAGIMLDARVALPDEPGIIPWLEEARSVFERVGARCYLERLEAEVPAVVAAS